MPGVGPPYRRPGRVNCPPPPAWWAGSWRRVASAVAGLPVDLWPGVCAPRPGARCPVGALVVRYVPASARWPVLPRSGRGRCRSCLPVGLADASVRRSGRFCRRPRVPRRRVPASARRPVLPRSSRRRCCSYLLVGPAGGSVPRSGGFAFASVGRCLGPAGSAGGRWARRRPGTSPPRPGARPPPPPGDPRQGRRPALDTPPAPGGTSLAGFLTTLSVVVAPPAQPVSFRTPEGQEWCTTDPRTG